MKEVKTQKKRNRWYPWAWSTRGFALGVNTMLLMQVTFYATESAGLSAGLVGTLLLVSRIFDGVTDLIAGFIIDKTHTKLGKARPYELFLIPTWILTVLLFSTPASMGTTGKAIYFFVLYVLINAVCVTFLSSSEAVFLARSTTDEGLRAKALTVAGIMATLFPTAVSIVLPILMASWGTQPGGWTKIMLVFGVPFTIIGLIRFFCIKEIETAEDDTQKNISTISFKDSIKSISHNKYLFILAAAALLCSVYNSLGSGVGSYYFQYIVGDLASMSLIGMLGILTPFVLLLFPLAVRKIGGMNFVRIGLVTAIIGNIIKYFAGANVTMILAGSLIAGIPGASALMMIGSIFVIQCMDYGEWKTGVRVEGMVNSVYGFATKVGGGLASGLLGLLMAVSGFIGGAGQQTASAKMAISWSYSLIPAILCVIMLVILHFYKLEKETGKIQAELEERRNHNA
ncbi:MFS transporter [Faecalicatena orotica]|uniref:GPH family glycoside/pentoside/hexuronide:cation symporter n=1 Tax=Faecalicatena orotica TaxID=1544 RepID=A0A2Y9BL77_9FIRM|nr:glycoside-pentoside-hexuronide (GPH):cation symporter [Faecalicatena orotica]PWJ21529.1 GPH family glycoside/pentoside/hexuronide:cation symporter [Faecalicatena orotica]SSA58339.1 glycoside/pentoside/hexuronide:cation symporter, GPH family [Faecalicatena orotica]